MRILYKVNIPIFHLGLGEKLCNELLLHIFFFYFASKNILTAQKQYVHALEIFCFSCREDPWKTPWVNMTRKHHPQVWCNYIFQGSHQLKKHSALINGSMYMYINITMSKYFEFSNSKEMDFSLLIYIKLDLF